MIIVDDLTQGCQTEVRVFVDDALYTGWVCAKPINPRRWRTRIREAWQILKGNAIGVKYFEDLDEQQKRDYVKKILPRIT